MINKWTLKPLFLWLCLDNLNHLVKGWLKDAGLDWILEKPMLTQKLTDGMHQFGWQSVKIKEGANIMLMSLISFSLPEEFG